MICKNAVLGKSLQLPLISLYFGPKEPTDRYNKEFLQPPIKHGGGCISASGIGDLVTTDGIRKLHEILICRTIWKTADCHLIPNALPMQ